jgi:ABC-type multidrug transport system permease subunit
LEFTSKTVQTIGHLTPVAWIMDGFKGILLRGWGLSEVLLPVGVLLGFALLCIGFSVWKFKFE